MNFDLLCTTLGIQDKQPLSKNLGLLKNWFEENISRDQKFMGTETEQWAQYKAVTESYFEVIEPSIEHDIDKPTPLLNGQSALSVLVETGLDGVLLKVRPSKDLLNKPNSNGQTSLHQAAMEGWLNTAKVLLSLGANTSAVNKQNQNPLFCTLIMPMDYSEEYKANKIALFELLKTEGNQSLSHQDQAGDTVLHQMAKHDFGQLMSDLLRSKPQLARIRNNAGHYPIHTAVLNEQIENARLLLNVKNTENLADSHGRVALHYAARVGNIEMIKLCCTKNSINVIDKERKTPLMLAAQLGDLDTVKALIGLGARVDMEDMHGASVLHHAVLSNDKHLVQWLLENIPDIEINAKDSQNSTPLDMLEQQFPHSSLIELLLEHGATSGLSKNTLS